MITEKYGTVDCESCESTFNMGYIVEMVSEEAPIYCPFCGEVIEIEFAESVDLMDMEEIIDNPQDGW